MFQYKKIYYSKLLNNFRSGHHVPYMTFELMKLNDVQHAHYFPYFLHTVLCIFVLLADCHEQDLPARSDWDLVSDCWCVSDVLHLCACA